MSENHSPLESLRLAVGKIGSQSATARLLGVTQAAVWGWLNRGTPLPSEHVAKLSAESGVPKASLRPDIFADERTPELTTSDFLDRAAAPAGASGSMDWKR